MLGNNNSRINNNAMNRRNHQYQENQEINDVDKNDSSIHKYYYQNSYNNLMKNNLNNSNSMNKQNIKMKMNIKNMTNNNNSNVIRKMKSIGENNNINKALMVIKNEFWKKDAKIKALELKIVDLEKKINMIKQSNNYQLNNNNNFSIININQKKIGKNSFIEKYSGDINSKFNKRENNLNKTPEMNYNRNNNPFKNPQNNNSFKNNYFIQTQSANKYNISINTDNEIQKSLIKNNNSNTAECGLEGSVFTGNSSNFPHHSKGEVKLYLKEVKSKVDPIIFKEFIKNIKLLTNSKNKNKVDKNSIIEKIRILFGEQFKDLFIKFKAILGFNV
jgi:hypothetical protein